MWLSDEEYVFQQDIKEKRSAGRGAFHKKCGSKSKKCTLPHERLTKKELEKMNGEVMTYNPNAWYSWEEFIKLPNEYQIKYVNSLMTRYNCSFAAVVEVVFGKKSANLHAFLKRRGSLQYINMPDPKIGKKLLPGKQKLKEAMERDLWPNRDEIQNDSNVVNDIIEEAKEDELYESPKAQIQKAINEAIKTVELYESRGGLVITPELINQIYEEKTGMSFAMAMEYVDDRAKKSEDPKPVQSVVPEDSKPVQSVVPEDSTDVQAFSIIMNNLDPNVFEYVRDLFDGKKYVVSLEVKEVKE